MKANKLFETLLDVIPFAAYAVDIKTNEVVYANKQMNDKMYASKEKKCWLKIFGQEDICSWCSTNKLKEVSSNELKQDKYSYEFFDEVDDKWIKSYDELLIWPDGREVKYSILVDISEQKAMQASLLKSHATLAINNKQISKTNKNLQITKLKLQKSLNELEVEKQKAEELTNIKSSFLANMSHEIRTPMNAIVGMTHLVKQTKLKEHQLNYINQIERASNNLLDIVNNVLDFSKIEAGKLKIENIDFDIKEVLVNIQNLLEVQAFNKGLKFSIVFDNINSVYYGDQLRIGQVILNLLSNAIKFTDKGEVKLTIENLRDDRVKFTIYDTGIGISEAQQEKIFDSFSQSDESSTRKYGGTGLGLSISKELVELMDGKIWIDSEQDIGSEFIFEIKLPKGSIDNLDSIYTKETLEKYEKNMDITNPKEYTSPTIRDELFGNLIDAIKTNRPKRYEPILKEIKTYVLSDNDNIVFKEVGNLLKYYKFKDAINIIKMSILNES